MGAGKTWRCQEDRAGGWVGASQGPGRAEPVEPGRWGISGGAPVSADQEAMAPEGGLHSVPHLVTVSGWRAAADSGTQCCSLPWASPDTVQHPAVAVTKALPSLGWGQHRSPVSASQAKELIIQESSSHDHHSQASTFFRLRASLNPRPGTSVLGTERLRNQPEALSRLSGQMCIESTLCVQLLGRDKALG
jgi:hypothetical protein